MAAGGPVTAKAGFDNSRTAAWVDTGADMLILGCVPHAYRGRHDPYLPDTSVGPHGVHYVTVYTIHLPPVGRQV